MPPSAGGSHDPLDAQRERHVALEEQLAEVRAGLGLGDFQEVLMASLLAGSG
ncbi:MAG TPA: hypothetical protein VN317_01860 [Candidatus Methanoperedens sp.]|nr:hypothetical protein [Candidatus Methanoperedens sp.]